MKALVFLPPEPNPIPRFSRVDGRKLPPLVLVYYNNLAFEPVVRREIPEGAAFVTDPADRKTQIDIRNRKLALPMDEQDIEDIALDALQWLAENSSRLTDHNTRRRISVYRHVLAELNIGLGKR